MWHLLVGGKEEDHQQQQQQQQHLAPHPHHHHQASLSQPTPLSSSSSPLPQSRAWRDASDAELIPMPGEFLRRRRKVVVDESLSSSRGTRRSSLSAAERRKLESTCHCAFNLAGFVAVTAGGGGFHAKHAIHPGSTSQSGSGSGAASSAGAGHQQHALPHHASTTTTSSNNTHNNNNTAASRADSSSSKATVSSADYSSSRPAHPPLSPQSPYSALGKFIDEKHMLSPSGLLPACRVHEIRDALPARFADVQWRMLFASDVDGFSVGSMYRHVENSGASAGACLLLAEVVESVSGSSSSSPVSLHPPSASSSAPASASQQQQQQPRPTVVGAFLSDLPSLKHGATHFYGGPETFVFSFDDDYQAGEDEEENCDDGYNDGGNVPTHPSSSSVSFLQQHHRHQHVRSVSGSTTNTMSSPTRKQRGALRVHRWRQRRPSCPEHFILSSASSLGIGGGPDGAALYFHENLQRGTSSAACAAFGNSCELAGKARCGLRHSEFRVLRLFIFTLDDSDFVEYPSRHDKLRFHRTFLANNKRGGGGSDSFVDAGGDDDDDDGYEDEEGNKGRMNVFPCHGCAVEPKGRHHDCSFLKHRRY